MIITEDNLNSYIKLLVDINTGLGYKVIKNSLLGSEFSSSPYIDDVKEDLATIVYNIMHNHCFSDGNKRTALCFLVLESAKLGLTIKASDDVLANMMLDFLQGSLKITDFITNVWN